MIDALYKDLLIAQLDKNWGKVAKIQKDINRYELEESRANLGTEGESSMEQDSSDVRDHEGTV